MSDKSELLLKIRALSERGVGGEKQNADAILSKLMKKYGLSDADLCEDHPEDYDFHWRDPFEDDLLRQIAYMVVGRGLVTKRYVKSRAKTIIICCTAAQRIEIQANFEFYRWYLKKGLESYFGAFIQKERLFPAGPSTSEYEKLPPPENIEDMLRLMRGMEKHDRRIQISNT